MVTSIQSSFIYIQLSSCVFSSSFHVLTRRTPNQSDFVAVHTFQGHKFGRKVVPVDRFFTAVAYLAGQESVSAAGFAGTTRVDALKMCQFNFCLRLILYFVDDPERLAHLKRFHYSSQFPALV